MSNLSLNQREEHCQDLNNFTKDIHREIIETISTLNWTIETIESDVSILISHRHLNENT